MRVEERILNPVLKGAADTEHMHVLPFQRQPPVVNTGNYGENGRGK
jgi:hypothetical protein